jgi:hypothetical protein
MTPSWKYEHGAASVLKFMKNMLRLAVDTLESVIHLGFGIENMVLPTVETIKMFFPLDKKYGYL